MPAHKKKKKLASNPARGFATVSLPSKNKQEASHTADAENDVSGSPGFTSQVTTPSETQAGDKVTDDQAPVFAQMTPDQLEAHLENAELQRRLEVSRSKSDIARQVARLQTERRTLRTQAEPLYVSSWLPDHLRDQIIEHYAEADSPKTFSQDLIQKYKDNILDLTFNLWTLEQTLNALHFNDDEALLKDVLQLALSENLVSGKDFIWGLNDAFESYAIRASSTELPGYNANVTNPGTETSQDEDSEPHLSSCSRRQPTTTLEYCNHSGPESTVGLEAPRSQIDTEARTEADESEDDNDPAKLVSKWIEIKRSMFFLEHTKTAEPTVALESRAQSKFGQRLQRIEKDILFDKYEANETWQKMLPKLYAELPLGKAAEPSGNRAVPFHRKVDDVAISGELSAGKGDLDGFEQDELFGDIFVVPDTFESSRTNQTNSASENTSVRLIDFGKWSGLHPRRVLEETCKQQDKRSRLSLAAISSSSFSNRHELLIQWSTIQPVDQWAADCLPATLSIVLKPKGVKLSMTSIATPTSAQSEAYVCTVALFVIAANTPSEKSHLRLPPVFRDLWEDLNQARKSAIDSHDMKSLRRLRTVASGIIENVEENMKRGSIVSRPLPMQRENDLGATPIPHILFDSETIMANWEAKVDKVAFQRMLRTREQLPVHQYRKLILETVAAQPLTIICAETGAGKSTQIPSFILEQEMSHGRDYRIMVTQPRRISAISLARRVSEELGEDRNAVGTQRSLVGYAIRLESKACASTRITFATTGVLLRILERSRNLDEIDCLILDEVHERTMDLDLLFIAIRRLQKRREDLKVILMSATVDAEKFSTYFGGAPILQIPGRTFPVEVGYLEDAIEATNSQTRAPGVKLPASHESDNDIDSEDIEERMENKDLTQLEGYSKSTRAILANFDEYRIDYDLVVKLVAVIATEDRYAKYSKAILVFMPGIAEIRRLHSLLVSESVFAQGWIVHLLHSTFSSEELEAAFAIPPMSVRKIVIATNIAETGITIPDVTAVIDSCKEKIMRYDDRRQMSKLREGFISRAASRQRRGRAARVQEGLCFHLVTRYRYENLMLEQQVPEMLRLSLQDTVLRIKIWELGAVEETLQEAIDPPTPRNIRRALEALKDSSALTSNESLTPLGKQIARLPLDVGMGKLAILGVVLRCLDAAITITAILSSKSPFLTLQNQNDSRAGTVRAAFARGDSDLLLNYQAYVGWQNACRQSKTIEFCRKHFLNHQNLLQIEDQKISLLVNLADAGLLQLDELEMSSLRSKRVNRRHGDFFIIPERYNLLSDHDNSICAVVAAAFYPKLLIRQGKGWRNVSTNQHVQLASSSLNRPNPKPPKWMSFYQASKTKTGNLIVTETSAVPEYAIILLLGDADFKMYAGVIVIDSGRVRFSVQDWKTMIALKILRMKMQKILNYCFRNPGKSLSTADEKWFAFWIAIVKGDGHELLGKEPF